MSRLYGQIFTAMKRCERNTFVAPCYGEGRRNWLQSYAMSLTSFPQDTNMRSMNGRCPRCGALITTVIRPYGYRILAGRLVSAFVGAGAVLVLLIAFRLGLL